MPEKKHLRGASAKEQRQYEHILEGAKKEGRYGKRAKEVAARTVMKQHGEEGHKPHRSSSSRSGSGKRTSSTRKRSTSGRGSGGRAGGSRRTHSRSTARKR